MSLHRRPMSRQLGCDAPDELPSPLLRQGLLTLLPRASRLLLLLLLLVVVVNRRVAAHAVVVGACLIRMLSLSLPTRLRGGIGA